MPTGFLQVMVTTQTALPLEDVKITIIDSATSQVLEEKTAYTDESGKTPLIELETAAREYSLDQDNRTVLPYKNYDLIIHFLAYLGFSNSYQYIMRCWRI